MGMTRKQEIKQSSTLVDVTIPAGSKAILIPYIRSEKMDIVSVVIKHDKDGTSEWVMRREEAVRLGIIADDEDKEELPEEAPESFA
jgi:hypothetical protein